MNFKELFDEEILNEGKLISLYNNIQVSIDDLVEANKSQYNSSNGKMILKYLQKQPNEDENEFKLRESKIHARVVQAIFKDMFGTFSPYWLQSFMHDMVKQHDIKKYGDEKASELHQNKSHHHEGILVDKDGNAIKDENGKTIWNGKEIEHIVEACIDWQSARFTKPSKQRNAYKTWVDFYRHENDTEHTNVPKIEKKYTDALKALQKIAEKKNLINKWGVWWDYDDGKKYNY